MGTCCTLKNKQKVITLIIQVWCLTQTISLRDIQSIK